MNSLQRDILISLADEKPYRDGYHAGNRDDKLSIELEYGQILYDIVRERKPKKLIEVGTGFGYSTSWLLLALEENKKGKLYTYDHENREPKVWKVCNITPSRLVENIVEFDEKVKLPDEIDFVFHDSQHRIELITKDLDMILPHLSKEAVVVVHDTKGKVSQMLKEKYSDFQHKSYETDCGLTILTKREKVLCN